MRAASQTARERSLNQWGNELYSKNEDADADIKDLRWQGTDGTVKGFRDFFQERGRAGLVTCELSSAYKTSYSDTSSGTLHFLNKTKAVSYTHLRAHET